MPRRLEPCRRAAVRGLGDFLMIGCLPPACRRHRHNGRAALVPATTFWEFPIRTLYREFPESRALRSPQSPCRHAVDRGLGSGSELQELAGGALDFEPLVIVRD